MRLVLTLVARLWLHLLHLLLRHRLLRHRSLLLRRWILSLLLLLLLLHLLLLQGVLLHSRLLLERGSAVSLLWTLNVVSFWHVFLQVLLVFFDLPSIWVSMKDFLDLLDTRVSLSTPNLWLFLLSGLTSLWDNSRCERLMISDLSLTGFH